MHVYSNVNKNQQRQYITKIVTISRYGYVHISTLRRLTKILADSSTLILPGKSRLSTLM